MKVGTWVIEGAEDASVGTKQYRKTYEVNGVPYTLIFTR